MRQSNHSVLPSYSKVHAISKCHICNNWHFCGTSKPFPLDDFDFSSLFFYPLLASFCRRLFSITPLFCSTNLGLHSPQVEVNSNAAHTSAAGMPSGGRHCNRTSCSNDTSFPRGSCSNDFFRSEERHKNVYNERQIIYDRYSTSS